MPIIYPQGQASGVARFDLKDSERRIVMFYVYEVYTQQEINGPLELVGVVPERRGLDRMKGYDEKGGLELAMQVFGPIVKGPTKIFIKPKEVI